MLRLHGFCASNYVNMVKFALLEKGATYEFVTQYPNQKADTLAISPMGKMPALETEHGILTETRVIMEYIDRVVDGPALLPTDPFQRARVQQLMHMIELYVELPARTCYPQALFGGQVSDETRQQGKAALLQGAQALARVTDCQPFLAGDQVTAADGMFLYTFDLAGTVAHKLFDLSLTEHLPGSAELMKRLGERDSARQIAADRDASMPEFMAYVQGKQ